LLFVLREFVGLGLTRSAILAAEFAILNNFFWNDRWTFGDLAKEQRSRRKMLKRLLKFHLICLMGVILKILLLNGMFNGLGMNEYLANLVAIGVVTVWNFWINLKLNWRVTEVE
jgi:dolichol-phosphate mannosyltransferase